jgi:PAS domain S-box-containing protein
MIVDRTVMIVSVNKAFEIITGFSSEEATGKSCSILNCTACEIARGGDRDHWCILFRKGNLKTRKCELIKKDGDRVHILKNASLLTDGAGEVIGAVETITDITEIVEKDCQIEAFRRVLDSENSFHGMLGTSTGIRRTFDLITNAAQSDAPVLILGESGTGKELAAEAIHRIGARRERPFIKVNCASLSEPLLESELFGHVRGAFTGAYREREGRFEAARGGDIFLDEIGDLPLSIQVKLLRVLEEKTIERVGDHRPIQTDVRIITATNRNLEALMEKGYFREDFFYRIHVIPIPIPPLRERVEDIPILSEFFFKKLRLKTNKNIQGITNDAMAMLMRHRWPGNIRELKSAFEYAFVSCQGPMIESHHFPLGIFKGGLHGAGEKKTTISKNQMKKRQLIMALEQADGNQSEAARILGVSRVTVWNRMKRFGIKPGQ